MLRIEALKASYGHIELLHGMDLTVDDQEIVAA